MNIQTNFEDIKYPNSTEAACNTAPSETLPNSQICYSTFLNKTNVDAISCPSSFDEFEDACRTPEIRNDKDGFAFCPATFSPPKRKKENSQSCAFLAIDLDDQPVHVTVSDVLDCIKDYRSFAYTTFSHKETGKGNRFRVVVEVNNAIAAHSYKSVAMVFAKNFEKLGGKVDTTGMSPAQIMYFPACPEGREDDFEFQSAQGSPLDWEALVNSATTEINTTVPTKQSKPLHSDMIVEGGRNNTLFQSAASMRSKGMEYTEINTALQVRNLQCCLPPLSPEAVSRIAESAARYPVEVKVETLTELVLARSVAKTNEGLIHWSGSWMRCNLETRLWESDQSLCVTRLMVEELNKRRIRESEYVKTTGSSRHQAIKEIERAESSRFLSGSEKLLQSFEGIFKERSKFDNNPYMVGLANGNCLDLKTGTVRQIEPTDYITKCLSAEYNADAVCPLWEKSILEWCCGNEELVRFLQVWCGYTLSGLTTFQGFLFLFGDGRNGKSVFVNIISKLLNKYSISINSNTLMLKNNNGGANGDIARLVGSRLVTSTELPGGKCFDEALLKQLTGGDVITARHLYQSEFNYTPQFKLLICGNHKPVVKGTDLGFWRRMQLVPFDANITKPDPHLTERLMDEQSGILNWCIEGWNIFQSEGLIIPNVVKNESEEYRSEMDLVYQWKSDCTVRNDGSIKSAKELYESYRQWSSENGYHSPMVKQSWERQVKKIFGDPIRKTAGMHYLNFEIK